MLKTKQNKLKKEEEYGANLFQDKIISGERERERDRDRDRETDRDRERQRQRQTETDRVRARGEDGEGGQRRQVVENRSVCV